SPAAMNPACDQRAENQSAGRSCSTTPAGRSPRRNAAPPFTDMPAVSPIRPDRARAPPRPGGDVHSWSKRWPQKRQRTAAALTSSAHIGHVFVAGDDVSCEDVVGDSGSDDGFAGGVVGSVTGVGGAGGSAAPANAAQRRRKSASTPAS